MEILVYLDFHYMVSALTLSILILPLIFIASKKIKVLLISLKVLSALAIMNTTIFVTVKTSILLKLVKISSNFNVNFNLSLMMDNTFIFFSTTAMIVSWSILEFSMYYMAQDPRLLNFLRLLLMFLLKMLILTSSNNLLLFLMGWEGVGFLSFLLIGWWFSRSKAKTSALQAMIYNRMGDMGIILFLTMVLSLKKGCCLSKLKMCKNHEWTKMILYSSLMAAVGKSAQFGLHPWLPAAMEGPTPVSALLHSSTMVVAGMFLLIRVTKKIVTEKFLLMCSILGSITAMFAATSAFLQHDLKKIMAYSTTSQLGLMVLAMGLGNPNIALFHICTHAFFKAMLFLCSGSIMHSYKNEQDLRKIPKIKLTLPMTSSCLFLGSMALMGIPFLSGYFSKDLILESMSETPSNLLVFFLASLATLLTAAYSLRMITLCFMKKTSQTPLNPTKEENLKLTSSMLRLAIGSIIMGWVLTKWLFEKPSLFPSLFMKKIPLTVTFIGAFTSKIMLLSTKKNIITNFFTSTWYYQQISHSITNTSTQMPALMASTQTIDRGWGEILGGQGMFHLKWKLAQRNNIIQTSYMKQYLLSITLLMTICPMLLFLL